MMLAEELQALLLMDDPAARREAKKRGLPLISTLDILGETKIQGLIRSFKKTLD